MKRLLILQIIGCLLFAVFVALFCAIGIFSPVSAVILYVILGLGNIINARNMLMKPIEHLSTHDKLTGVYNRIKLESKIPEYERYSDYAKENGLKLTNYRIDTTQTRGSRLVGIIFALIIGVSGVIIGFSTIKKAGR